MKREPNPYASNPILTVTNTMSISVPSMVAEDVIDGDADKVTGVDPAVLEEIKETIQEVSVMATLAAQAYNEVVALQDTVDTMKDDMDSTSRLSYGIQAGYTGHPSNAELTVDTADGTGLAYFRLTGNGHDVSVSVNDLQNLVNGSVGGGGGSSSGSASNIQTECLAYAQIRYDYSSDSLAIKANNDRGTGLNYYKLAAKGLVSSDYPNAELRLYSNDSGVVELQLSGDYGRTWSNLGEGGSSSGSGSTSNPDTEFVHGSLSHYDPALVFETESGSEDCSFINNYYDYRSDAGVAIILGEAPSGSNLAYPIITPGIINAANRKCRLSWIDKANKGGDSAIWDLQYTTDGGRNWNSLGVGSGSGGGAETVRYTGNQYPYLALHLHSTGCLSFTNSYGETISNIEASAITNFDKNCSLAIGVTNNMLVFYNGDKYVTIVDENGNLTSSSGGSNIVTTTSSGISFVPYDVNYTQLIADASSGCINFVTQREDGDITETGLRYGLQVALAAFDDPTVRLRLFGNGTSPKLQVQKGDGYAWEDFAISGGSSNSGSSSSSNTVTFGPIYGDSKQYELSLALNGGRTDYASAIVELKEPTDSYQGVAALGAYLAAPASSYYDNTNYDRGVLMAVSGMGTLVFRRNSEVVKYDLNNLGGSSSGSSVTGEETVRQTGNQYPYLALHLTSDRKLSFRDPHNFCITSIAAGNITNPDTNCELSLGGLFSKSLKYYNGSQTITIVDENGNLVGGSGASGGSSSEATFTVDILQYDGVDNLASIYDGSSGIRRSVVSIRDADSGAVYPIATTGWACPEHNKTGVFWNQTDQGYRLQFTEDGGRTWSNLGGGGTTLTTTSSGIAFGPANPDYTTLLINQGNGNRINFISQTSDGVSWDTGLGYGLQVALAAFDAPEVKLRFSGNGTSPKLQVKKSWDADWEDFVISEGNSNSGSSGSSSNTEELIIPHQDSFYSPCAMQIQGADSASIVIDLYSKNVDFYGDIALNCGLASGDLSGSDTIMTVHSMGKLLFKYMGDVQVFDLNNLGGTGSSGSSGSTVGTPTSIATYINDDANGYISSYDVAGEFKVLRGSGRHDDTSGVVTLYLEDEYGAYISGVNVLLNTALTAGRNYGSDRYLSGGIRPVISEDGQTLSWEYRALNGYKWSPVAASDTAGYLIGKNDSHSAIVPLISNSDIPYVSWGVTDPSNNLTFITSGIKLLINNAIGTYPAVGQYTSPSEINGSIVPKYTNGELSWCYSDDGGETWQEISSKAESGDAGTTGTLPIYYDRYDGVREEGALSVFTYDTSNAASSDSIILELRAEANGYALSASQIVLNTALTTVNEDGHCTSKALRMYDDTELDCVKWQLRSKDNPNNWSDAPIAATVLISDSSKNNPSIYEPLTVSIHAGGWLYVKNRTENKSHTIVFEDLEWLCDNIDKLKALIN